MIRTICLFLLALSISSLSFATSNLEFIDLSELGEARSFIKIQSISDDGETIAGTMLADGTTVTWYRGNTGEFQYIDYAATQVMSADGSSLFGLDSDASFAPQQVTKWNNGVKTTIGGTLWYATAMDTTSNQSRIISYSRGGLYEMSGTSPNLILESTELNVFGDFLVSPNTGDIVIYESEWKEEYNDYTIGHVNTATGGIKFFPSDRPQRPCGIVGFDDNENLYTYCSGANVNEEYLTEIYRISVSGVKTRINSQWNIVYALDHWKGDSAYDWDYTNISALNSSADVFVGTSIDSDTAIIFYKDLYAGELNYLAAALDLNLQGHSLESALQMNIDGSVIYGVATHAASGENVIFKLSLDAVDMQNINSTDDYPALSINTPVNGSTIGISSSITFNATANDEQDGDISTAVSWESSIDGFFGIGETVVTNLSEGIHTITTTVSDSDNNTTLASVQISITNNRPNVIILSPSNNALSTTGTSITFSANADDIEDGNLNSAIAWSSNISGFLGYGQEITITPLEGDHIISASVIDNHGKIGENSVAITVINTPPNAVNDNATLPEGASHIINLSVNDIDTFEGLDLTSLLVTSQPAFGSVTVNTNGTATYIHNGSESIADSFTYTIKDNGGAVSNTAVVSISVVPVNDAPVANNDQVSSWDNAGTISINLIGNDIDNDDGLDPTSILIESAPEYGTVIVSTDGSVQFTPNNFGALTDVFSYSIADYAGDRSNIATVDITVKEQGLTSDYFFDFTDGLPAEAQGWSYYSSNVSYGRIAGIEGKLRMDVSTDGQYSVNEAIFTTNLLGANNAMLSFFQSDHSDEANAMPTTFSGHSNSDGVAISTDGITWYSVLPSVQLEVGTVGQEYLIDLDVLAQTIRATYDVNFAYGSSTQIKFQQYDNYTFPTDGREWDNIKVNAEFSKLVISPKVLAFSILESHVGNSQCKIISLQNTDDNEIEWELQQPDISWINFNRTSGIVAANTTFNISACWNSTGFTIANPQTIPIVFTDLTNNQIHTNEFKFKVTSDSFFEDFSLGLPNASDDVWDFYSSDPSIGSIVVVDGYMQMAVTTSGEFNLNEATVKLDLQDEFNLQLSFTQKETADENHTMPETFTGHSNSDGVAMSDDGITWYSIASISQLDVGNVATTYTIDLDVEISRIQTLYDASFNFSSTFYIKFQQYDNYTSPTDGREWTNISVKGTP